MLQNNQEKIETTELNANTQALVGGPKRRDKKNEAKMIQ